MSLTHTVRPLTSQFTFLQLPAEIRNMVYGLLSLNLNASESSRLIDHFSAAKESDNALEVRAVYALTCASKQVRMEYLPLFLQNSQQTISFPSSFSAWIQWRKLIPLIPFRVHFDVTWVDRNQELPILELKPLIDLCRKTKGMQVTFGYTEIPVESAESQSAIAWPAAELNRHNKSLANALKTLCKATLQPETKAEKKWQVYFDRAIECIGVCTHTHIRWYDKRGNMHELGNRISITVKGNYISSWMNQGNGATAFGCVPPSVIKHWVFVSGLPGRWHNVIVNDTNPIGLLSFDEEE